jgi:hypothetical protein
VGPSGLFEPEELAVELCDHMIPFETRVGTQGGERSGLVLCSVQASSQVLERRGAPIGQAAVELVAAELYGIARMVLVVLFQEPAYEPIPGCAGCLPRDARSAGWAVGAGGGEHDHPEDEPE